MAPTISLEDLRNDHANAEAEVGRLEEDTRLARERRDRLADMIQGLEEWQRERERLSASKGQVVPLRSVPVAAALHRDPTAAERVVMVLEQVGHTLSTRELAERLVASGYTTTSKKPIWDHVHSVLTGAAKAKSARLVKVGTKWGLRGWEAREARGVARR